MAQPVYASKSSTCTKVTDDKPSVWVLAGVHAGDTAQALALARSLGWRCELKQLIFNHLYVIPNVISRHRLWGLSPAARKVIQAPWPDLVIAVGRRSVPAAQWIKRQSGGHTKLVHLGRPQAPLAWFDLIITTPQYGLPQGPNVLHNLTPLTEDPALVPADELATWQARIQHLPRPWIGVLVGGSREPYVLDENAARDLAEAVSARARAAGGSLLVSTSPRTGAAAAAVLQQSVSAPAHVHIWTRGGENPHKAFLALADRFIVTGESVSMMTEACRTGRPTEVYALPRAERALFGARRSRSPSAPGQANWRERLRARLHAAGLISPRRNVELFVDELVARRHLTRLGEPELRQIAPLPNPMDEALIRVRALFGAAS
ncbi:mitochondrial fission ELM1 family protein [Rhodoligotrophos defluvii]|uniref:mitochondrial fission ELM1 family protein n=1 Tax=Rhodoligotrophos defluvii TaxID=2561934 RepID=UPI001485C18F|nr:mitochondrial fission ELM1 family protein [Rhodoligotrophos defluvii]